MEMRERKEVIKKACELAMKAQKSTGKPYIYEDISPSSSIFAFDGSWSVNDWFSHSHKPFGETEINLALFPFLQSVGNAEKPALVNAAFARRFEAILSTSLLAIEVEKAVDESKKLIFAGHSSGGAMAILATLWFLNKYTRTCGDTCPLCVTFGSPLVGDRIFPYAIRRENWARYFVHFVIRSDIVPLIMLAPFTSIEQQLSRVLDFFNLESVQGKSILTSSDASTFFTSVMVSASCVASLVASNLMGCTNLLLDNFHSFIELSPYRPFGTYVFLNVNDVTIVVENVDAVSQMLLYVSQLGREADSAQVAYTKLKEHMVYEEVLEGIVDMQNAGYLDNPKGSASEKKIWALNCLGLSRRAMLCLRAAEEVERRKRKNEEKISKDIIKEELRKMREYRTDCERRKIGYYDAFKLQNDEIDFKANTTRLVLAGIWDDIIEMVKKHQLPDEFEVTKEWIELGTQFRRLVEPIDVANYYRDGKNHDGGNYFIKGRPRRYRFTQRWLEHNEKTPFEPISESCFMAEVEEIKIISYKKSFKDLEERIVRLERQILEWNQAKVLGKDVFLDKSTFTKWWNSLPEQHKLESCIKGLFSKYN